MHIISHTISALSWLFSTSTSCANTFGKSEQSCCWLQCVSLHCYCRKLFKKMGFHLSTKRQPWQCWTKEYCSPVVPMLSILSLFKWGDKLLFPTENFFFHHPASKTKTRLKDNCLCVTTFTMELCNISLTPKKFVFSVVFNNSCVLIVLGIAQHKLPTKSKNALFKTVCLSPLPPTGVQPLPVW